MRKSGPPRGLLSHLVLELPDERPHDGYEIRDFGPFERRGDPPGDVDADAGADTADVE